MNHRRRTAIALGVLGIAFSASARPERDAAALIEKAFEAAKVHEARARDYVYHERVEERRFNRRGEEKTRQSKTWDVTQLDSSDHRRLIALDDRPLDAAAAAREQRRLDKQIRKMRAETPRQRRLRLARVEKEREEGDRFLEEITKAFDFRWLGEEEVGGIPTDVIFAEPRSDYVARGRQAKVLTKVRAKLWISQTDDAWVQADIETLDDIVWPPLYRLRQGARIRFNQRRLDEGVWVTERWNVRFLARIALVYRLDAEFTGTYSNFRRFTTETIPTGWTPAD